MSADALKRFNIPRGIKNNNPLNLREAKDGGDTWLGERATDDDPQFEEFEYVEAGFRAATKTLIAYQRDHGLKTIAGIIGRWAPAKGKDGNGRAYTQNTKAYIGAICNAVGVDADDEIDVRHYPTCFAMVKAMTRHENGPAPAGWEGRHDGTWYADAVIRRGIELAGIHHTIPPASQSPTATAATAGGLLGTGLAANEAVLLVDKAGGLAEMEPSQLVRLFVIIAIVCVCGYIVLRRSRMSGKEG